MTLHHRCWQKLPMPVLASSQEQCSSCARRRIIYRTAPSSCLWYWQELPMQMSLLSSCMKRTFSSHSWGSNAARYILLQLLILHLGCTQAVLVAYHRARQWPEGGLEGGLMAATGLSAAAAAERLEREGLSSCVVACDNSPTSTTLSGAPHLFFVFAVCFFNGQCHSHVLRQYHRSMTLSGAPHMHLHLFLTVDYYASSERISSNFNLAGSCITGMTLCTS